MKAKDITKLRKSLSYYLVQKTKGNMGDYYYAWLDYNHSEYDRYIVVLAKSPLNAVYRARKRGYGKGLLINFFGTKKPWSRFRVWREESFDSSEINYY